MLMYFVAQKKKYFGLVSVKSIELWFFFSQVLFVAYCCGGVGSETRYLDQTIV